MNITLITDFLDVVSGMDKKAWYLSKTQWTNMIALVVLALVNFGVMDVGLTTEEVNTLAIAIVPVVNMILRGWFTKVPLTKNILPDGKVAEGINELEVKRMVNGS